MPLKSLSLNLECICKFCALERYFCMRARVSISTSTKHQFNSNPARPATARKSSEPYKKGRSSTWQTVVLAAWVGLGSGLDMRGYGLWNVQGGYDDVQAQGLNHIAWGSGTIHYYFDANFDAMFPDPRTKDQVRQALKTWAAAATTPKGTVYSYLRPNPSSFGAFVDVRSVTLHELGHVLGFVHPSEAAAQNLNFIPGADAQAGCANPAPGVATGQEVMNPSIRGYNHLLSWDELDAYCQAYGGRSLTFSEVASGGELLITAYAQGACQGSCLLAQGFPSWQYTPPSGPGTIYKAKLAYNTQASALLGTSTHGVNWDIVCNSLKTHKITIQTHGTDNLTPMDWWNNNATAYVFGSPSAPPTAAAVDADHKDDLNWTWSNPAADIPAGTLFHVGIELDVCDWTVVNSFIFNGQNNSVPVALTVAHDFNDSVFLAAGVQRTPRWYACGSPAPTDASGAPGQNAFGVTYLSSRTNGCVSGIAIQASGIPQTIISGLEYADVTGRGLALSNLNPAGLSLLRSNGVVTTVTNFGTHVLGPNGRFVVMLQGDSACLPLDVSTNGNYLALNQPQLLSRELFLHWQSANNQTTVQNFALVGEPIIGNVPSLTINLQEGGTNLVVSWPGTFTGFILQQSARPNGGTNWVDVPTVPIMVDGRNQVPVFPASGDSMFYRLRKE
jgi:hypothetical protein